MYPRIRNLREDKDLSQQDMGDILGYSQRAYSRYECGKAAIPIEVLINLAKYHETSVDYLLELTDEKTPYPPKKKKMYI